MVTVIAGIASAKIAALLIGPSGVGLVGLIQGVSAVVAAVIEVGLASAVVRAYGSVSGRHRWPLAALGAAARRVVLVAGAVMVAIALATSQFLSEPILGADRRSIDLALAAVAAVPVALTVVENGLMIAAHRVRAVARTAVCIAFVSPVVSLGAYSAFGEDGVAPGAVVSGFLVWAITACFRRRESRTIEDEDAGPGRGVMTTRLLRDGVPVMGSALVGAAAVLVLPLVVESRLGRDGVGYYRASNVISLGYTAAVIAVIGADFLPRVSRIRDDPAAVRRLISEQIDLLVSAFVPLLCLVGAVLPLAVTVLYRKDFSPTVSILEWQLVGDVFRMAGSVLATALFARFGGLHRLALEVLGLAFLVTFSVLGLVTDAERGLGWGFIVAYVVYVAMLWLVLRMPAGGRVAHRTALRLLGGAAVVALPPLAAEATSGDDRMRLVGVPLALLWGAAWLRKRRRATT